MIILSTFDNEGPRHRVYLYPFAVSQNLVKNGDYLSFMERKGYEQSKWWLSAGWDWQQDNKIKHPLYWKKEGDTWFEYTLHGYEPLDPEAPVCHISYYEADAYARWKGSRLPTEAEMEVFLKEFPRDDMSSSEFLHPLSGHPSLGQLWCWTGSHYSPYPKYKCYEGTLGEYNGKFMCKQFVLRGGCVATPPDHYRHSYRNYFEPHQRWMFSGLRLAKDL